MTYVLLLRFAFLISVLKSCQLDVSTPEVVSCPHSLCNGRVNGNYEYEYKGEKRLNYFLQCSRGRAHCQACWPVKLVYKQECNQCLYSKDDSCGTTEKWDPLFVAFCPDVCTYRGYNFSGNMADPFNYYHYAACWKGVTIGCVTCPDGLMFNEEENACTYDGIHMTEPDPHKSDNDGHESHGYGYHDY